MKSSLFLALGCVIVVCLPVSVAGGVNLVAKGAAWKYLDDGSNQGTAWTQSAFPDDTWRSGAAPLGYSSAAGMYGSATLGTTVGYGGNTNAKHRTTYFRRVFTVSSPASLNGLALNLLRDDGAVVYLNGAEVARIGMPAGAIASSTYATETIYTNSSYEVITLDPAALVEGANVLAIELHQVNATSSDLVMDAELVGDDGSASNVSHIVSGPWVGAVTPAAAVFTLRLDRAGIAARVIASTSADLSNPVASAPSTSLAASGEMVRLQLSGLEAGTTYYYAVEVGGVVDLSENRRGSFRTFPYGASNLRIGFGACAQTDVAFLSFNALLAASPDLFINMGDFHYSDTNSTDVSPYRANFARVFNNASQAALYRNVPTAYVWDDHDYCGNDSDRNSIGRDAVRQVYREWVPHYPLPAGATGPIHQSFSIGRARVIVTDLRSEADPQSTPDTATKTKMGAAQKAWFKQQLLAARDAEAPVILWVCSAPWIGSADMNADTWQNNTVERRELADFIKANAIKNVVLLSGDMHALAYDDGTHSDYATGGGAPLRVLHAAALGRNSAHTKGGPYSSGAPIQNPDNGILGQYGLLDIVDAGGANTLGLTFTGWRAPESTPRLTYAFTTLPVKPRPPLQPAASADANGIHVTWLDDSTVESGFRIERASGTSSPWTQIGEAPANAGSFRDGTAMTATAYRYRVIAFNSGETSAPSAEATATALTSRQAWKLQTLGDAWASDVADPDGDGLANLAEYGLGTHPAEFDFLTGVVVTSPAGQRHLALNFNRPSGRTDVATLGEVTGDLGHAWSSSPDHVAVSVAPATANSEDVSVRDRTPLDEHVRRFLRLRFTTEGQ